ncbi:MULTISPECIES: flagellar biosynthesis protein FlgE [Aeromonas]|uniref:flagellar biosynthesis protein FlgE n=1 Tax=unclassified Aeromonas TaxID=257493 RepID=UPI000CD31EBC|nr:MULTISPECIES: flagellar biosynthesis protein FlgE [unclassified Aeromonas]AUV10848.1 flagellar biosynthesis protein FlgE [Aeromonas sp. ASNIH3]BBQ23946.1 flagellar hook protein FlgE [Aeromonas sp. WP2-W18-CRE-05]
MRIESAMTAGVQGFQRAEQLAGQASSQIARLNTSAGEQVQLPDELVNLKVAELHAGVSAKVIQTASDMLGTLIDIRV